MSDWTFPWTTWLLSNFLYLMHLILHVLVFNVWITKWEKERNKREKKVYWSFKFPQSPSAGGEDRGEVLELQQEYC